MPLKGLRLAALVWDVIHEHPHITIGGIRAKCRNLYPRQIEKALGLLRDEVLPGKRVSYTSTPLGYTYVAGEMGEVATSSVERAILQEMAANHKHNATRSRDEVSQIEWVLSIPTISPATRQMLKARQLLQEMSGRASQQMGEIDELLLLQAA